MANWKYRLDLTEEWKQAEADELTPKELANVVARKIESVAVFEADEALQDIANQFGSLEKYATFDDFDDVLAQLYDWADQEVSPFGRWPINKMCWVATF